MTRPKDGKCSKHADEDVASTDVTDFAAWLHNAAADDRNVSEIVRRLRKFWNDAFQCGVAERMLKGMTPGLRRSEADIDAETERDLIDHGV